VGESARAFAETFLRSTSDESGLPQTQIPIAATITDEKFRKFVAALGKSRNLQHGYELFVTGCAICHRIGTEGSEVGPDLLGQIGMAEESLLKDILMPSEKIRPGYETTLVETRDGGALTGILKTESPTSVTLVQASGAEQTLLRKDIAATRQLGTSFMPSFAETLSPSDAADLLGWLRSNLGTPAH
jgi:putative heme-binding domain-containing protein